LAPVTFGKFQIQREVGRGAMGVVYAADDPVIGDLVALKVVSNAPVPQEARQRRLERFLTEANTLSSLRHPGVVRLYERGEVNGRHYFTMELLQGHTLHEHLRISGALSLSSLVRLAGELCHALDHIHSRWVVHRDVKPENIMLLGDGTCKLMDFGIAQLANAAGPEPEVGMDGSPAYMSPEQVSHRPVDHRTDIYSLGVTLYEAATGRRAVEGDSLPAILHRVVYEYPPAPQGLPPALRAILRKALAKEAEHRYASAAQMLADLTALQPGLPSAVEPARSFPDTGRLCAVHAHLAAVAACGACGRAVCDACLIDVRGKGSLCRLCAFKTEQQP